MKATRTLNLLMAFYSFWFLGCGDNSQQPRQAVFGTVSVDGEKAKTGSISFLPERGTLGPAATAVIVDGRYRFTTATGPYQGSHRVVIGIDPNAQRRDEIDGADGVVGGDSGSAAQEMAQAKKSAPIATTQTRPQNRSNQPKAAKTTWQRGYVVPPGEASEKNFDLMSDETD